MKKLASVLMATLLTLSLSARAFAADNTATSSGGKASSVVELTAEAAPTSFYVPFGTIATQSDSENNREMTIGEEDVPLAEFPDVNPNAWYYEGVSFCIDNGLMDGYDDGFFYPNEPTTRAMLVQILWNLEGNPIVDATVSFNDVSDSQWFAPAVRWAASVGIIDGYGNGNFGPDDNVLREQLVTIMWRYAKYKNVNISGDIADLEAYEDATAVSGYATSAMEWACGSGVVNGTSSTTLSPSDGATRAQMATVMMRYVTTYGGVDE